MRVLVISNESRMIILAMVRKSGLWWLLAM
jgi:hypothetical protein